MTQEVVIKTGEGRWVKIAQQGMDLILSQSSDEVTWEPFAWIWWVNGQAIIGSVEIGSAFRLPASDTKYF